MKQIEFINLAGMSNGAHFDYVSATVERVETDEAVKAKVASEQTALTAAVDVEDEYMKLSQKSEQTAGIAAADKLRDKYYMNYKKAVKSFLSLPEGTAMRTAADTLWQHITDYRIDTRSQLNKETGELKNFTKDLAEKYADEVNTLGLGAFVENITEQNDTVHTRMHSSREGDSERL